MKFIVNELPYYGELCPFYTFCNMMCEDSSIADKCPRYWSKYKVCSTDNPHECWLLIEASNLALTDNRCCQTCKHPTGDWDAESSCAPCYGYSNWEAKDER